MKNIFFLSILISISPTWGEEVEKRREKILSIIDQELREVAKLSSQYRHQKPRLLLRIAELYLEKARLVKDKEQRKYLKIPSQKRSQINKKRFFAKSRKYFSKAQRTCEAIIRKFRRFKLKSNVYYILAFNAKEFDSNREAKKYFSLALKNTKKGSQIYKKSSLALAELHYNEKNYGKAISLYKSGTKGKRDKWWTRDAFNLAWSHYRKRQFTKALSLMNEVYRLSSDSQYVDMRPQVETDIGIFYVSANRFDEGVKFYRSLGKDISSHLKHLGKVLMDRNKPIEAEKVFMEAKQHLKGKELVDVNLTLLSLFYKYGNYRKHIKISRELLELAKEDEIEDAEMEVFLFQLKKVGGVLQRQVLQNAGKLKNKDIKREAEQVGDYFSLIAEIDKKERGKYLYLKAETFYAAKMMEAAFNAYKDSFEYSKSKRNNKQVKLSIEGMLAALASPALAKKASDDYYISAYNAYLKVDRKSKKAEVIHQRVFQKYFDKRDFKNAENVLRSYKINYPKNLATQEVMIAKIMEHYRKAENQKEFSRWVKKIRNKEYFVSKRYGERLSSLLLSMRFSGVEKAANAGDKKSALEGYLEIYENLDSSDESKKNAAHNIAVLYFELGYADDTYTWVKRAVDLMNDQELIKFAGNYLAISSELFNMQRFEKSAKLSEMIYNKICRYKVKEKISFYKNSYIVYLASDRFADASRVINTGKKCKISSQSRQEGQLEILKILREQKRWKFFERHLNQIRRIASLRGQVIAELEYLRDAYKEFLDRGRASELAKEMESLYKMARRSKQKISTESLWAIAQIRLEKMDVLIKQFNGIGLEFPQKKFDALLNKKFILLDQIAAQVDKTLQVKSGKGSVRAYQLIIESYQRLVKEIREFQVVGKSAGYVKGFRKAMRQIENALLKKSLSYLKQARKLIEEGKVLSPHGYWFISSNRIPIDVEYHFTGNGILMDRRGKR